ncbi:MAG: amphi-Trp domain-containing protein [bacterium]|nr:amphi-Trp domain-containing protein [bacterium]
MGSKISYKTHTTISQALAYLEEMIMHLKEGKAVLQHEDEFVTLKPSGNVTLEVEASAKKGKESLILELKWHQESEPKLKTDLKISAEEPEQVASEAISDEEQ